MVPDPADEVDPTSPDAPEALHASDSAEPDAEEPAPPAGARPNAWTAPMNALGGFIRAQRQLAKLSLRDMATMTSVSNAYLSQVERGLHQPSLKVLHSIADALQLSTEQLLTPGRLGHPGRGTHRRRGRRHRGGHPDRSATDPRAAHAPCWASTAVSSTELLDIVNRSAHYR